MKTHVLTYFALVFLLCFAISCSRSSTTTNYYYPADLKARNLPTWHVTNAIPLTPDQAALAAMSHVSTGHPSITTWDVDSIDLRKEFDTTWVYRISMIDRRSGHYNFEVVKVLMDGSIWLPTTERREP